MKMKSKPSHVTVRHDRKYNSAERMIRRFIKLCKRERIREEYREKSFFKSKSEKRREKSDRARRRREREERKAAKRRKQSNKSF
jgi:ribosomal protein S21